MAPTTVAVETKDVAHAKADSLTRSGRQMKDVGREKDLSKMIN